ncbi:hypothetical protein BJF82_15610 [Kytococcus sp. CUA-901]|nr:hypothetical protein BJF82_15610 [Kytococcus sp. CUA-901]
MLVPEDATEFTGFARQVVDEEPDLIFVAWAGATAGNMWQSLTQQDVFDAAPVVTGLADSATFAAYGDAGEQISFLSHYFPGRPTTRSTRPSWTRSPRPEGRRTCSPSTASWPAR